MRHSRVRFGGEDANYSQEGFEGKTLKFLLKDLVRVSDIILENFTPRVMARFGLDYASLRAVKPDLIMVSNTGYGHSGPWRNFGAMASALEPTHGTGAFMGYLQADPAGLVPEDVPNKMGNSYTDFLASWTALTAIMASLIYRARTGRGNWIDLAMYQVGVSFIGEGLLDYAFNGRRTRRLGNRHESMSPHGWRHLRSQEGYACQKMFTRLLTKRPTFNFMI